MTSLANPTNRRQFFARSGLALAVAAGAAVAMAPTKGLAGRTQSKLRKAALRFREADRAEADLYEEWKAKGGSPTSDDLYRRIDAAARRWCVAKNGLEEAMREAGVEGVLVDGTLITCVYDRDDECYRVAVVEAGNVVGL